MEGGGPILEYRSRLDTTLASPDLMNDEMVHTLLKNQMLQSSCGEEYPESVVDRRSREVSNFLNMLRSASAHEVERSRSSDESRGGWKVKQDTEEFRVMYREGPEGTPFHTLLVEGYVDGPIDACLCISWESDLYKKWWPQTAIPTFKVLSSQCVKKLRDGEQISLVRMKVSWPLSSREALVHYFTFEYFKDGLIVILLNTISDLESVDRSTHGFTREGIPDAEDVVRIDVVGGFAIQKVAANRSYFRTIANMDIKLDFVPPTLINFIARQLIGSGFRLYKKEVASVSKGDKKFLEALKGPLYTRIGQALFSQNTSVASPPLEELSSTATMVEGQRQEPADHTHADEKNERVDSAVDSEAEDVGVGDTKVLNEIECEENDTVGNETLDESVQKADDKLANEIEEVRAADEEVINPERELHVRATNEIASRFGSELNSNIGISPVVQEALGTLEKAISVIRDYKSKIEYDEPDTKERLEVYLKESREELILSKTEQLKGENGTCGESSEVHSAEPALLEPGNVSNGHDSRHEVSNSYTRETNQSKVVPASLDEDHMRHINVHTSLTQIAVSTVSEHTVKSYSPRLDANGISGVKATNKKNKKSLFCCFNS